MAMLSGNDIVCFAIRPWDSPWKNNQQVMMRLAASNRVLYVNPPRSLREALRACTLREDGQRSPSGQGWTLRVFQEPVSLPRWGKDHAVARLFNRRVDPLRMTHVQRMAGSLGFRAPILWVYDPLAADALGKFRERLVVYSVIDSYTDYFPPAARFWRAMIKANHQRLLEEADVVFAVSEALRRECLEVNPNSFLLPNGVDVDLYQNPSRESETALAGIPAPVIGYAGVVTEVVDLPLLEYVAVRQPHWSLVIVGPIGVLPREDRGRLARLIALPNVYYLGSHPVQRLPALVMRCDVVLMPYRLGPLTRRGDSLKLYEYMASGRPIVSTDIPSARRFLDLVEIAESGAEFVRAIERSLEEPPERAIARRREAERHSWTQRVEVLSAVVAERLNGSRGQVR